MAKKTKPKGAKIETNTGVYIANPVYDVATKTIVEDKSEFIESLNHKCWIVQINRTIKKQMREEDGFARYMQDWLYNESKAMKEMLEQKNKELEEERKKNEAAAKEIEAFRIKLQQAGLL